MPEIVVVDFLKRHGQLLQSQVRGRKDHSNAVVQTSSKSESSRRAPPAHPNDPICDIKDPFREPSAAMRDGLKSAIDEIIADLAEPNASESLRSETPAHPNDQNRPRSSSEHALSTPDSELQDLPSSSQRLDKYTFDHSGPFWPTLRATGDITAGTRIMEEEAAFKHPEPTLDDVIQFYEQSPANLQWHIRKLNFDVKVYRSIFDRLIQLGRQRNDARLQAQIYAAFRAHWLTAPDGRVLSPTVSYFQHSCIPNVHVAWNNNICKFTVHAVRDIKAGEELTVTYFRKATSHFSCLETRFTTLSRFSITCQCRACDVTLDPEGTATTDARWADMICLRRITSLDRLQEGIKLKAMEQGERARSLRIVLRRARTLVIAMEQEGIATPVLAKVYQNMALWSGMQLWRHNNFAVAAAFSVKAMEILKRCLGEDNELVMSEAGIVKRFEELADEKAKHLQGIAPKSEDEA